MKNTFTSESVCAGHPDKICDQISDAILDEAFKVDKYSRVAVETMVTKNFLVMAGEVTTKAKLNYKKIAQKVIRDLGYTIPALNFSEKSKIVVKIHTQSPEIAVGVDDLGAGDQGCMFGYASNETKELMPLPIMLAHRLAMGIDELRNSKGLPYLRPDGKTQVTVGYERNIPKTIENVILAVPHQEKIELAQVKEDLFNLLVSPILKEYNFKIKRDQLIVNGTGVWHIGGPASDTGVTGRKIIVDTYGGMARVGGGAFSGKDPTKVDRSASYMCRYIAKNIVAAGLAERCEIQVAYTIGRAKPVSVMVGAYSTGVVSSAELTEVVNKLFDLRPRAIIERLDLLRPIYKKTCNYGHFGRDLPEFSWEKTDMIDDLKRAVK